MTISSSATTEAVTASRVTLALVNAPAMSAPNAGPPVTWACSSAGRPVEAALRSLATTSLRVSPDRSALTGTTPMAALPSADTCAGAAGMGPPGGAAACMRSRAAWAAATPAGPSAAPSVRLTTTIRGTRSPPGNWRAMASTLAESEPVGTDSGACPAAALAPTTAMKPMPSRTAPSANCHERRPVTAAATRSHTTKQSLSVC